VRNWKRQRFPIPTLISSKVRYKEKSMSKKTIGWLYFVALISQIILALLFLNRWANYNNDLRLIDLWTQQAQQPGGTDVKQSWYNPATGSTDMETSQQIADGFRQDLVGTQQTMITVLVFMGLVGILSMIAWIGTLINLSRAQLWAWFVLTFFFGGIMILIYLVGGPQPRQTGYSLLGQPGSAASPSSSFGMSPQAYQLPSSPSSPSLSALEILQQRYARGEIDTPTFQQMREML
jgi:hypothetical protein